MSDETETTPAAGAADDVVVMGGTVADQYGVLAEGAVAIQGDHALVVARFANTTSARAVYDDLLAAEGRAWAVVGSAATALQGCRLEPQNIDLLTQKAGSVFRFAEALRPFAAAESTGDFFLSTPARPVFVGPMGGLDWHFGRWMIAGLTVEVAHIAPPEGYDSFSGPIVWECGPAIWPHHSRTAFAVYSVPVVPLEFQVGTNLDRGRTEHGEDCLGRVREVARVFRENGYDRARLEWAMDATHVAHFDEIMRTQQ
jgi:hypothetical protein